MSGVHVARPDKVSPVVKPEGSVCSDGGASRAQLTLLTFVL